MAFSLTQLPEWREKSLLPKFHTSASKLDLFMRCRRAWWFESVRKLPVPKITAQTFGTVLHGVTERWLKADDHGRDETGNPVDITPPGWDLAVSRFAGPDGVHPIEGSVAPGEQVQILKLVEAAIENGILARVHGREIEAEFEVALLTMQEHGIDCTVKGFIDLLLPDAVEDHKTTKATKWMKSPNELKRNVQMLLYSKILLERIRNAGGAIPPKVWIRHIYYCKDPEKPIVRKVEAQLTPAEIDEAWKMIQLLAMDMAGLRMGVDDGVAQIPPPANTAAACNAYGGCPFRFVCWNKQPVEDYIKTFENLRAGVDTSAGTATMGLPPSTSDKPAFFTHSKENRMSLVSSVQKGGQPAAQAQMAPRGVQQPAPQAQPQQQWGQPLAAPAQPVASFNPAAQAQAQQQQQWAQPAPQQPAPQQWQQPAPQPAPQQAPQPTFGGESFVPSVPQGMTQIGVCADGMPLLAVPWANPACPACKGTGWVNGLPCPVCKGSAANRGVPSPNTIETMPSSEPGVAYFRNPLVPGWEGRCPMPGYGAPAVAQEQYAAPQTPTVAAPNQATGEAQVPSQPGDTAAAKERRGRPKKSFIICVNCAPIQNVVAKDRDVMMAADLLQEVGAKVASQLNQPSYFQCDPFQRKDYIRAASAVICSEITSGIVVFENLGTNESDLRALYDALRLNAGTIIFGT